MNEITATLTGNLTDAVELHYTATGDAVANFTVAATRRAFDRQANEWRDAETLFMRCTIWRTPAENLVNSLGKGDRVIVTGRLKQRSFETSAGDKRTVVELDAYEVGASLQFRPVKVAAADRAAASVDEPLDTDRPPF